MDDASDIRRRIKAARMLADLTVPELAKAIGSKGLGAKALGSIERGERGTPAQPHELAAIAAACGLPYEFFTVDFADLPRLNKESPDLRATMLDGSVVSIDVKGGLTAEDIEPGKLLTQILQYVQGLDERIERLEVDATDDVRTVQLDAHEAELEASVLRAHGRAEGTEEGTGDPSRERQAR